MDIHLCNFRCWENQTFSFPEQMMQLLGESGKGKSTILEAIVYALYGKLKKVYNREHGSGKPTIVSVHFRSYNIYVERTGRTVKVKHEHTEMNDIQAQSFIDSFFGSYELFMITSYFRSEEVHPLLSASQKDKTEVMMKIFPDAEKFSMYKERLKTQYASLSETIRKKEYEKVRLDATISSITNLCPHIEHIKPTNENPKDLELIINRIRLLTSTLEGLVIDANIQPLPDRYRIINSDDERTEKKIMRLKELGDFDIHHLSAIDEKLKNHVIVESIIDVTDVIDPSQSFVRDEVIDDTITSEIDDLTRIIETHVIRDECDMKHNIPSDTLEKLELINSSITVIDEKLKNHVIVESVIDVTDVIDPAQSFVREEGSIDDLTHIIETHVIRDECDMKHIIPSDTLEKLELINSSITAIDEKLKNHIIASDDEIDLNLMKLKTLRIDAIEEILRHKLPYERFNPSQSFDERIIKLSESRCTGKCKLDDVFNVLHQSNVTISSGTLSHRLSDEELSILRSSVIDNMSISDEDMRLINEYRSWKMIHDRYSTFISYNAGVTTEMIDLYLRYMKYDGKCVITQNEYDELVKNRASLIKDKALMEHYASILSDDRPEISRDEYMRSSSKLARLHEQRKYELMGMKPVTQAQMNDGLRLFHLKGKTQLLQNEYDELVKNRASLIKDKALMEHYASILSDDRPEISRDEYMRSSSKLSMLKSKLTKYHEQRKYELMGMKPVTQAQMNDGLRLFHLKGKTQLLQNEYDELIELRSRINQCIRIRDSIVNDDSEEILHADYERRRINDLNIQRQKDIINELESLPSLSEALDKYDNASLYPMFLTYSQAKRDIECLDITSDMNKLEQMKEIEIILINTYNVYIRNVISIISEHVHYYVSKFFSDEFIVELTAGNENGSIRPTFNISVNSSPVSSLSTGERKRLSIVLMMSLSKLVGGKILLFDESLNSISPELRVDITDEIEKLHLPTIITTHDIIPAIDMININGESSIRS